MEQDTYWMSQVESFPTSSDFARLSGEQFNLFSLIRVGHLEVATHTPILADLLNPDGSHGQGKVFLEKFLPLVEKLFALLDIDPIKPIDQENVEVLSEKRVFDGTGKSLGQVDIWIKCANSNLVIENKINADDQERQLERYSQMKPSPIVVYLTLDGRDTSEESMKGKVVRLSYQTDVRDWLIACRKEAVNVPCVREGITHYLNLVKSITNQNPNSRMTDEISNLVLSSSENLTSFQELIKCQGAVRGRLIEKVNLWAKGRAVDGVEPLDIESKIKDTLDPSGGRYSALTFSAKGNSHLLFGINCERSAFRQCLFGFYYLDNDNNFLVGESAKMLQQKFSDEFGSSVLRVTDHWPAHGWWSGNEIDWGDDTFLKIFEGGFFSELNLVLKRLEDIANAVFPPIE